MVADVCNGDFGGICIEGGGKCPACFAYECRYDFVSNLV